MREPITKKKVKCTTGLPREEAPQGTRIPSALWDFAVFLGGGLGTLREAVEGFGELGGGLGV